MATVPPIVARLEEQALELLVESSGRLVYASDRGGINALKEAIFAYADLFDGADVALPAVGLGAAYLLIHAKAGRVYAQVMSHEARRVLEEEGIEHGAASFVRNLPQSAALISSQDARARDAITLLAFVEELKRAGA